MEHNIIETPYKGKTIISTCSCGAFWIHSSGETEEDRKDKERKHVKYFENKTEVL